jgi:hypothetical protein
MELNLPESLIFMECTMQGHAYKMRRAVYVLDAIEGVPYDIRSLFLGYVKEAGLREAWGRVYPGRKWPKIEEFEVGGTHPSPDGSYQYAMRELNLVTRTREGMLHFMGFRNVLPQKVILHGFEFAFKYANLVLAVIKPTRIDISIIVLMKVLHEGEHFLDIFIMSCIVIYNPVMYGIFELRECEEIFDELCSSSIEELVTIAVLLGYFNPAYAREYVKGMMRISKWTTAICMITNMGGREFIEEFIFPKNMCISSISDKEALRSILINYPECISFNLPKVLDAMHASGINMDDIHKMIDEYK